MTPRRARVPYGRALGQVLGAAEGNHLAPLAPIGIMCSE